MAGSVIRRRRVSIVDEMVVPDDIASSFEEADLLAGHRVDRRKAYAIIDDNLCELVRWTQACTGCTEVPEMTTTPARGLGCRECGYAGRVRHSYFYPCDTAVFRRLL